jgi:hypothetical protein
MTGLKDRNTMHNHLRKARAAGGETARRGPNGEQNLFIPAVEGLFHDEEQANTVLALLQGGAPK